MVDPYLGKCLNGPRRLEHFRQTSNIDRNHPLITILLKQNTLNREVHKKKNKNREALKIINFLN